MRRALLATLAIVCLTAFAPAPFPRPNRGSSPNEVTLESIQGEWRVPTVLHTRTSGKHVPHSWKTQTIRIEKDEWAFVQNYLRTPYTIVVDHRQKPATIDFYSSGNKSDGVRGRGIIRRVGKRIEIVYLFSTNERAKSFDTPPDSHWYITLER